MFERENIFFFSHDTSANGIGRFPDVKRSREQTKYHANKTLQGNFTEDETSLGSVTLRVISFL